MKRHSPHPLWAILVLVLINPLRVFAQQAPPSPLQGSVSLGIRGVDVGGTTEKFLQDVNLDDGARVSALSLKYEPSTSGGAIDLAELDATGLGGDPFESIHLGLRKFGAYDVKLDHRRSEYFYEDTILPLSQANIAGSTGGDFHHFDFERIRDSAAIAIDVAPMTQLSLGLERQTRSGDSTTTQDIQRDEFELERPLDETSNVLTFGVRHAWERVTLVFEEQVNDFRNTSRLFLPGASPGANTSDPAALDFFLLDQSYDFKSRGQLARLIMRPTDRVDVSTLWRHENLDLDMPNASESSGGSGFTGAPFVTAASGSAAVGRSLDVGEVEVGARVHDRVRVVGSARHNSLSQDGAVAYGVDLGAGNWDISTDAVEAGVEIGVSSALTLAVGWSAESRDLTHGWTLNTVTTGDEHQTDRAGFFARLDLHMAGGLELDLSIEDNNIDDPFTLASATDSRRYKLKARRRWDNGLSLSGSYRATDVKNVNSAWQADTAQGNLRLVYQRPTVQASVGYARMNFDREIEQLVTGGTRQDLFAIDYSAAAVLRDASARWQINQRIGIGTELRAYDNHGSFRLARDDLKGYVDVGLGADYVLQVGYRDLDYAEDAYDAYDARILELTLTLRWQ